VLLVRVIDHPRRHSAQEVLRPSFEIPRSGGETSPSSRRG
jgi:hypothetical protein